MKEHWKAFIETGDLEARNAIVTNYVPLADKVANWVQASLPPQVDRDDINSSAYFGLIDAVDRYDPERGFKFETFATPRIRGAILDHLRSADWAPRSLRSKGRELMQATEELTAALGKDPSDEEIAERLGWDIEDVWSIRARHARSQVMSLDPTSDEDEDEDWNFQIEDPSIQSSMDESFNFVPLMEALSGSIEDLPPKERIVFNLFYFEGASLAEIGKVFNVTESRICQVLTTAALTCKGGLELDHLSRQ